MPRLYILAGCNGAGKTTAAYTLLPRTVIVDNSGTDLKPVAEYSEEEIIEILDATRWAAIRTYES